MAFKDCKFCEDTFFIGAFLHPNNISLGLLATQTGVHKIAIKFIETVQIVEVTIANIGDEFTIPLGTLNEDGESIISIENPDNTTYSFTSGLITYECFKVKLLIQKL